MPGMEGVVGVDGAEHMEARMPWILRMPCRWRGERDAVVFADAMADMEDAETAPLH